MDFPWHPVALCILKLQRGTSPCSLHGFLLKPLARPLLWAIGMEEAGHSSLISGQAALTAAHVTSSVNLLVEQSIPTEAKVLNQEHLASSAKSKSLSTGSEIPPRRPKAVSCSGRVLLP